MRTAWITLRHAPPYRSDAFAEGFENIGFRVRMQFPNHGQVRADDVVVTWNLNPRYRGAAHEAKRVGAAVLVAENGYVPKKGDTTQVYALARDGHNGSGFWFVEKEDRWSNLGYDLPPWQRNEGGHILICEQRGIGSEIMKCPMGLYEALVPKIKRIFAQHDKKLKPEIRKRAHPGRHQPQRTLLADLKGARACVTWASNCANEALLLGIPTFRTAPYHVNEACLTDLKQLIDLPETDRLTGFQKLAWAQWFLPEIESGQAFRTLLQDVL